MADEIIRVEGIIDVQKALRRIDKDLPKELGAGLAEAAEIVAGPARAKFPVRTGAARDSLKVKKQQRKASLSLGGNRVPYAPWLDFGGRVGPNKTTARPFIPGGRYIYPTLRDKSEAVMAKVEEVLDRLATRAGF